MKRFNIAHIVKDNKGAMFGLDARLALAIFAGLSAVTTYSIINVIGDTNKATLASDMKAVAIAYENMILATGTDTSQFSDLYENTNNIFGWAGPYIELDSPRHNKYGAFSLMYGDNGESQSTGEPSPCKRSKPCSVWASLDGIPTDVAYAVDELVDGKPSDYMNGRVRIRQGQNNLDIIYYKVQPKQYNR